MRKDFLSIHLHRVLKQGNVFFASSVTATSISKKNLKLRNKT
jgi:hypothetical protein